MKILIFTDNHFCESSSIVNKSGAKYSLRLENQIKSLNWVEDTAVENGCGAIICLGDFFDKPNLTDNELTALRDIKWSNLPHYFLVGNHESEEADLCFSSTKALESANRRIISEPTIIKFDNSLLEFLPYTLERNRKQISEYFAAEPGQYRNKIILSHNDLKGIQMGLIETKVGFELKDIENNCDLFINGHLHNGVKITNKIINLGNLTGQNFSEDATKYKHRVMILETTDLSYTFIENPYAFNFYSLEISTEQDFDKLNAFVTEGAVITVKCLDKYIPQVEQLIRNNKNIVCSRLITTRQLATGTEIDAQVELVKMTDYWAKLDEFCHEKIENTAVLNFELAELCK